jgi:hypothetical protein
VVVLLHVRVKKVFDVAGDDVTVLFKSEMAGIE